ncbi:MAG: hypothetical protein ACTSQS_19175 [Promethearchaeota archaeon]
MDELEIKLIINYLVGKATENKLRRIIEDEKYIEYFIKLRDMVLIGHKFLKNTDLSAKREYDKLVNALNTYNHFPKEMVKSFAKKLRKNFSKTTYQKYRRLLKQRFSIDLNYYLPAEMKRRGGS